MNSIEGLAAKSKELEGLLSQRRSVREFSSESIPIEVLVNCIKIAGSAPSGANCQPWTYVLIQDKKIKKQIRLEAEKIENKFYNSSATKNWRSDLKKLNVKASKPFLEEAPYLIAVFVQKYGLNMRGEKIKHYYPTESAYISIGMLLAALHQLGLHSLTYTPAPIDFLSKILNRPENERPLMIIPVGFKKDNCTFPDINRKELKEIVSII